MHEELLPRPYPVAQRSVESHEVIVAFAGRELLPVGTPDEPVVVGPDGTVLDARGELVVAALLFDVVGSAAEELGSTGLELVGIDDVTGTDEDGEVMGVDVALLVTGAATEEVA